MNRLRFFVLLNAVTILSAQAENGGAILVNGASTVRQNHCHFFRDLKVAEKVFANWRTEVYSSKGPTPKNLPNGVDCDKDGNALYDSLGRPKLKHYDQPGAQAANLDTLNTGIRSLSASLPSDKPIVLYFTDHGSPGRVSLAGKKGLGVEDLRAILSSFPPERKVVLIHDHCYSGSMLEAIWKDGKVRPNTCGIAAAAENELAYVKEELITYMSGDYKTAESFGELARKVGARENRQSTILSSSDLFLDKYLRNYPELKKKTALYEIRFLCAFKTDSLDELAKNFTAESSQVTLNFLLKPEIERIQNQIFDLVSKSGLGPKTSARELEDILNQKKIEVQQADEDDDKLSRTRSKVTKEYVSSGFSKDSWANYETLQRRLDALRDEFADSKTSRPRKEIEAEVNALLPGYNRLDQQADKRRSEAENEHGAFMNFVRKGAAQGKWPADIVEKSDASSKKVSRVMQEQSRLLKLGLTVRKAEALDSMIRSQDFEAIKTYLNILECEATPIRSGKGT